MESVIIANENVKPSYPTPQNLRTYKFSMMDQIAPSMLIHVILFFQSNNNTSPDPTNFSVTLEMLKRSLSVILSRFYPLAGRINSDGKSIDCNDEGVHFVVSKFTPHKLSNFLRNPERNLLRKFLPPDGGDRSVVTLQVNGFDCGGIAIGAAFNHKVVDAVTISSFFKSWANLTRGCRDPICPNYIFNSIFPHKKELSEFIPPQNLLNSGKSLTRRYVFDASAISQLKSESDVERPTRVEVVTSLIWKCFISTSLASESLVSHVVNLRRRAAPPFPSECFGNFAGAAVAKCSHRGGGVGDLVRKVREAISEVGEDYVGRMRGDDGVLGLNENIKVGLPHYHEGVDYLGFTSWASLGFYSVDFGWGKPVWVANCDIGSASSRGFINEVFLMDTRNCDGIEAWINLEEKYMYVLDNCEEIRAFASLDPSPLDI